MLGEKKRDSSWTMSLFWGLQGNTSISMRRPNLKGRGRWPPVIAALTAAGLSTQSRPGTGPTPKAQPSSPTLSSWLFLALPPPHSPAERRPGKMQDISDLLQPFLFKSKISKRQKYALNAGKNTQSIFKLFSLSQLAYVFSFFGIDLPTEPNVAGHTVAE